MNYDDQGMGWPWVAVPFFIGAVALVIVGLIVFGVVAGLVRWSRNNNSPLLTVPAQVVTKRTHTSGGSGDTSATTSYYATFEVPGQERIEFSVGGRAYGLLVEGDRGRLTYQGSRYKGFDRTPQDR